MCELMPQQSRDRDCAGTRTTIPFAFAVGGSKMEAHPRNTAQLILQTTRRYVTEDASSNDTSDSRHPAIDSPLSGMVWNAVKAVCLLVRLVWLSLWAALSLCILALIGPPLIALILIIVGGTMPATKPACDALLNGLSWLLLAVAHFFYPPPS
jgi:hypothetical protein